MSFYKTLVLQLTLGVITLAPLAQAQEEITLSSQAMEMDAFQAALQETPAASCNSAQTRRLFDACIYQRANCWEYNPGGYCYGVPSLWGRCYGRRPPRLGC